MEKRQDTADTYSKAFVAPNPVTPNRVIVIDTQLCDGCNICVDVCRTDIMLPNPEKGRQPVAMFPDECWFCGSCVSHCPIPGAITVEYPLNQRVGWKRKETGEYFRIGMKDPPPANTRPAAGCGPRGQ